MNTQQANNIKALEAKQIISINAYTFSEWLAEGMNVDIIGVDAPYYDQKSLSIYFHTPDDISSIEETDAAFAQLKETCTLQPKNIVHILSYFIQAGQLPLALYEITFD